MSSSVVSEYRKNYALIKHRKVTFVGMRAYNNVEPDEQTNATLIKVKKRSLVKKG